MLKLLIQISQTNIAMKTKTCLLTKQLYMVTTENLQMPKRRQNRSMALHRSVLKDEQNEIKISI